MFATYLGAISMPESQRLPVEHALPDRSGDRWADIDAITPAIKHEHIRDTAARVPEFSDAAWPLDALGIKPGGKSVTIYFDRVPGARSDIVYPPFQYADALRRVTYLLLNEAVPPEDRQRRFSSAVEYMAPGTIKNFVKSCRTFMEWLTERGVECLSDCTPALLDAFYAEVVKSADVSGATKYASLSPVERLALMAPSLPESDRLCAPSWSASDARQRGRSGAEGSNREVLAPETADPLLAFVVRCVRVLAPDILAAHDRVLALAQTTAPGGGIVRAKQLLQDLAESGGIPAQRASTGRLRLDASGLAQIHGISAKNLSLALREAHLQEHLNGDRFVTVDSPIHGLVNDRPWCVGVPWKSLEGDLPEVLRHLQAACWVLLAFLSGARPEEVRALPIDPLDVVPPRVPGGAVRYFLRGPLSKGQRDETGRASLTGKAERWVTVGPAVDAVRVAAELAHRLSYEPPQHLFPGGSATDAIGHSTMAKRVRQMVEWANELMVREGWPEAYRIVHDKEGYWDLAGFRRTTAWHIRKEPDGEVALAWQYKHLSTSLGDGYASTSGIGVRRVMDRAAREAHDEVMTEVATALVQGTHVSGPAAERLIEIAQLEHPLQATYATEREARRMAADGRTVFDNPGAYSLCVFDPRFAKCLSPGSGDAPNTETDAPDRGSCQASCVCHARTDVQIDRLRAEVDQHRRESTSPLTPEPLALRLGQVADRKALQIEAHEATSVFINLSEVTVRSTHPPTSAESDDNEGSQP